MWFRPLIPPTTPDTELVAAIAARLAVFFRAGVHPRRAWQEVGPERADDLHRGSPLGAILWRVEAGETLGDALLEETAAAQEPWRILAAVYWVAHQTGTPMGDALWALSQALRERQDAERAVRSTLQAPLYTQRLLLALPLLGLLVAGALGVDAIGFLTGSALGGASLFVALGLVAIALVWTRRLITWALPGPDYLSPALDLLAIATAGGASPEQAKTRVEQALEFHGLTSGNPGILDDLTRLSRRVGVPLRALAQAEASWMRVRAKAHVTERAEALSVKILLPLGGLILPAFVLVGVVPVVFALLQGALTPTNGLLW